jgi:hypothetical protein
MTTSPPPRWHRKVTRLVAGIAGAVAVLVPAASGIATAADTPTGFFYGTDSNAPAGAGTGYTYTEPVAGGVYGGYVGEVGTWTDMRGCASGSAFNVTAANRANVDEPYRPSGQPIPGVFFYFFGAGPGADPAYNATYAEAYAWGVKQAEAAVAGYERLVSDGVTTDTTYIPMMFLDVEGGAGNGYANGWNEEVNCRGQITKSVPIPPTIDRATFNGFWDYTHVDTIFHPGVYSTRDFWDYTFGTGSAGAIPDTYEWTANWPGGIAPDPVGFCQAGSCARWFGDIVAGREAGWQWSGGTGDYDQWDTRNLP